MLSGGERQMPGLTTALGIRLPYAIDLCVLLSSGLLLYQTPCRISSTPRLRPSHCNTCLGAAHGTTSSERAHANLIDYYYFLEVSSLSPYLDILTVTASPFLPDRLLVSS